MTGLIWLRVSVILLVITLVFQPLRTHAQEKIEPEDLFQMSLKELMDMKVTGVSKYDQGITRAPASVIVITEQQLKNRGYEDLSDVLRDVPGFDIVDNARGFGEFYSIRGIEGNDRFLILIDGQKINSMCGTFLSIGNSISVRFVKQIEIIFGPGSAIYGADAFAAIINIISKNAKEKLSITSHLNFGNQNTIDGSVEVSKKVTENFNFFVMTRIFQSNGPDFLGRDTIYNVIRSYPLPHRNKFEQPINDHTVFIKSRYKNFIFSYFRQRFDEGNSLGLPPDIYVYNKEAHWKLTTNLLASKFQQSFGADGLLFAELAYFRQALDPSTRFYKWRQSYQLGETISQYMTGKCRALRGEFYYNSSFKTNLRFISGMELEISKSIPSYANDQVLGNSYKYEGENAAKIDSALTVIESRYAWFGQATYSPFQNIDVVIGGRFDYFSRYKDTFNPRMGFIVNSVCSTTLKFIYGTAFQAPSLFYQYEQWGSNSAVMLSSEEVKKTVSGWKLKNQKIETYEVTLSRQFSPHINLKLAGYHHHLKDLIERVAYTDSAYNKYFSTKNYAVYSPGFRNENIGVQYIYGLNLDVNFEITNNVVGYFFYSYTDAIAKKSTGDFHIPRISQHKIWAGLTVKNLFRYFTISSRLKWVSDIYNRNREVFPSGKQPGFIRFDTSVSLSNLFKNIRCYAYLVNLLGSEIDHGGLYDQSFYLAKIPQPGFTVRVGMEIKL